MSTSRLPGGSTEREALTPAPSSHQMHTHPLDTLNLSPPSTPCDYPRHRSRLLTIEYWVSGWINEKKSTPNARPVSEVNEVAGSPPLRGRGVLR